MRNFYDEFIHDFGVRTFIKGRDYNPKSVKLIKLESDGYYNTGYFKVLSQRVNREYDVMVEADFTDKEFSNYACNCPQYNENGMCKHIAAAMINYHKELFNEGEIIGFTPNLKLSKNIIEEFYKPKAHVIRKKLNLEITLEASESWYYGSSLNIKYRIGEDKLYSLNGKYTNFLDAYEEDGEYKLAQKFTYDGNKYYFNETDKKILDFSLNECQSFHVYSGDSLNGNKIDSFMRLLINKPFYIERVGKFNGVKFEIPFNMSLKKDNDVYVFEINDFNDFTPLIDGDDYFYGKDWVYKVPKDFGKLYYIMRNAGINSLRFEESNLPKFTNGILKVVMNNVSIDESAGNIVTAVEPSAKLYFDFYYNAIECKVILEYGDKEFNVFDTAPTVVRDMEYENIIFEKLGEAGFVTDLESRRFLLEDIDAIGAFLENDLETLSTDYEVFTSKKIKDTEVVTGVSGSANFSIGKDNIMSYGFELDGVDGSELADLIGSMRAKKKYYKLKSGALINLEGSADLQKLEKLASDMDLSGDNLVSGEIPKYRAIYYDSLRHGRYGSIIKTNNLFDDLVKRFKAYKDSDISLPDSELEVLRDYQKVGVKWLYNIYKCGFGGILADEMGLGKSIQLIYLVKLIVKENPDAKILIVAPTSLIYNWKKEFDKFGSELKYKVFAENKTQRQNDLENVSDINVFITTYGLVRNDADKYNEIYFDLIAIDEAQNIKNAQAQMSKVIKSLNADVKVALTGTPLENSVMELWSIFDFIMPGYLANNKRFKSLYNVKDVDDEGMQKLSNLNLQISNFILRRKKKDVVKELPDKIENNIYVELGLKQQKLYAAEVQKTKNEMDELMKAEGFNKARFKILQLITRLRQICIDPNIVFDNYTGGRAKIEQLVKLASEIKDNGHKMLIFTSYKTALDIAIKELTNAGISSYYIDGSVSSKKRMELVEKFNNDDTDVFLITLKAGGTGLNLTAATVVIHLDLWWNPQVENQATDRAHRIGQKKTVEVIRLIASGTIEERILELQEKKRKLADALIEGDMRNENQFSSLTEKDLQLLLSLDNEQDV